MIIPDFLQKSIKIRQIKVGLTFCYLALETIGIITIIQDANYMVKYNLSLNLFLDLYLKGRIMNHASVWAAVDYVAASNGLSRSGLARACGLDATAFNKSKRIDKYGKLHWPSCITIAKIISFAHISPEEFGRIIRKTTNPKN